MECAACAARRCSRSRERERERKRERRASRVSVRIFANVWGALSREVVYRPSAPPAACWCIRDRNVGTVTSRRVARRRRRVYVRPRKSADAQRRECVSRSRARATRMRRKPLNVRTHGVRRRGRGRRERGHDDASECVRERLGDEQCRDIGAVAREATSEDYVEKNNRFRNRGRSLARSLPPSLFLSRSHSSSDR